MENNKEQEQGSKATNIAIVILKILAILGGLIVLAIIAFFVSCLAM